MTSEAAPLLLQFGAEGAVVVNFSVHRQHEAPVSGYHWLMTKLAQLDDGQTSKRQGESQRRGGPCSASVGPAIPQAVCHLAHQQVGIGREIARCMESSKA